MSKPTKAKTPEEQYKKERKNFLKRMKPKPVLSERIKKKEIREQERAEKRRKFEEID